MTELSDMMSETNYFKIKDKLIPKHLNVVLSSKKKPHEKKLIYE
jgi:hypothetical protein